MQPVIPMEQIPSKREVNAASRNDLLLKRAPVAQERGEREKVHSIRRQIHASEGHEGLPRGLPHLEHVPSDSNQFHVKSDGLQKCAGNHKCFMCLECEIIQ